MDGQSINIHEILTLCDPHHHIVDAFGLDKTCLSAAAVCCKRECSQIQHRIRSPKHQFITAKQFYSQIKIVRDKYKQFTRSYRAKYIPSFIKKIRERINSFEDYIVKDYLPNRPLIENFCRYDNNYLAEAIQQLIEEPLEDIELAALTCKDVSAVKALALALQSDKAEEEQKRIQQQLKSLLDFFLRRQNLLPKLKHAVQKDHTPYQIQANSLSELSERLEFLTKNYNVIKASEERYVDQLNIRIQTDFIPHLNSANQTGGKIPELQSFLNSLHNFSAASPMKTLVLAINSDTNQSIFWQRLLSFLVAKKTIHSLIIITTRPPDDGYIKKQADLFHPSLSVKIHYNICLNDKRPSQLITQTQLRSNEPEGSTSIDKHAKDRPKKTSNQAEKEADLAK